jgi:hypothetical protein
MSTDERATAATPAECSAVTKDKQPLLVLHLDVNKTLIMIDPAANVSMPQVVNGLVAASTLGRVTRQRTGGGEFTWAWHILPEGSGSSPAAGEEDSTVVNYEAFVKDFLYPYSKAPGAPADEQARLALHNKAQKEVSCAYVQ